MSAEANASNYPAFDPKMWGYRAAGCQEKGGYDKLGWVNATGPLEAMVKVAGLKGDETIVDVGTGSGTVLNNFASRHPDSRLKLIGFDISLDMLKCGTQNPGNRLFVADAYRMPLTAGYADLVVARMVFHHLPDIPGALDEIKRILKPGGRFMIGEYVAADPEVQAFEREVFDLKERGRHLWTGPQMADQIAQIWSPGQSVKAELGYGVMPAYSVRDWMGKSGLPQSTQQAVLDLYLRAPEAIVQKMNIQTIGVDGTVDALVDRPFAFATVTK